MPYITDDDSKAAKKIAEIEQQLQETKAELDRWLAGGSTPSSATELAQREQEGKALTDRLQALATALQMQRAGRFGIARAGTEAGQSLPQEDEGLRLSPGHSAVSGRAGNATDGPLLVPQSGPCGQGERKLLRPGTVGRVRPHCTPALASEVAQLAAALGSFEDAQSRLRQMGVNMSIRRIATVAYHFAQRARRGQELEGMGIGGSLAGKRVVISTDGGRLRVRKNKRGKKTKKGRSRYRTDWREPKLLVIYVVDDKGRIDRELRPSWTVRCRAPTRCSGSWNSIFVS